MVTQGFAFDGWDIVDLAVYAAPVVSVDPFDDRDIALTDRADRRICILRWTCHNSSIHYHDPKTTE